MVTTSTDVNVRASSWMSYIIFVTKFAVILENIKGTNYAKYTTEKKYNKDKREKLQIEKLLF